MVIRLRKCLKVYHTKALKIIQAPSARLFHCFLVASPPPPPFLMYHLQVSIAQGFTDVSFISSSIYLLVPEYKHLKSLFLKKEKLACKINSNKRIWNTSNIVAYLSVKQKHMQMINANKYFSKPYFNPFSIENANTSISYLPYSEKLFES